MVDDIYIYEYGDLYELFLTGISRLFDKRTEKKLAKNVTASSVPGV